MVLYMSGWLVEMKTWAKQESMTKMHGAHIDFESIFDLFRIRCPSSTDISFRSGSGSRDAES